jgi:multimeric flavodoxin WrbA
MKVVAIVGSPHADGNTSYLTDVALEELAGQGIATEKIVLVNLTVNPCRGHSNCDTFAVCQIKDDAPGIIAKFLEADAVILASPVYYYDVSAQMKCFIDRNYFAYMHDIPLKARYAGLIAIGGGGGADETIATLKRFTHLPEANCFCVAGYTSDAKNSPELVKQAREMGKKLAAKLIRKK